MKIIRKKSNNNYYKFYIQKKLRVGIDLEFGICMHDLLVKNCI